MSKDNDPNNSISLQKIIEQVPSPSSKQTTIICAANSESLISAALLSKSIVKAKKLFQIKYSAPIISFAYFNSILERYQNSTIVLIGITVIDSGKLFAVSNPVIMIAGTTKSRSSRIHQVTSKETIPVIVYHFAKKHFETSDDVHLLTALGTLLEKKSDNSSSEFASKLINSAIKNNLLERIHGFKLFGQNTLPIYDSFFYSIDPYIPELSGNEIGCNSLVKNSTIPISKRPFPLSKLKTEEVQSLTQYLVSMIDPKMVREVIGPDYALLQEHTDNPLRVLSNLQTLIKTSLARQNMGDSFAVLLGDRTRALRNMIDSHMIYCRNVLSGFNLLNSRLKDLDKIMEQKDEITSVVSSIGINNEALSDVAIIAQAHGVFESSTTIMKSESSMDIVFNHDQNKLNELMKQLVQREIEYSTPTKQSVRLSSLDKKKQKEIQKMVLDMGGD